MREFKLFLLAICALLPFQVQAGNGPAIARQGSLPHKLIFQVTDSQPQKWYLTLSNARNVQQELGRKNVRIEIVVYGPGLDMVLLETEMGEKIDEALAQGISIIACENTMIGHKLTRADMYPGLKYVKAGVVHLMKRQQEGWAYIRP